MPASIEKGSKFVLNLVKNNGVKINEPFFSNACQIIIRTVINYNMQFSEDISEDWSFSFLIGCGDDKEIEKTALQKLIGIN